MENVISVFDCLEQQHYSYEEAVAIKMAKLSAIAYSDTPDTCLNKLGVSLDRIIKKVCDSKGNDCSGFTATWDAEKAVILAFRGTDSRPQVLK